MIDRVVRMRASPAVGVGGMYATGEGLDEVIRVLPMIPPFIERQNWLLQAVDGSQNKVRVVFVDDGNHTPWAWSFVEERPIPEAPLVLTANEEKQIVRHPQPIDNGIPNAYTLMADLTIIGASWYAGTNQENQVVFKVLPIGIPDEDKPYWVLTPSQPE